MLIGDHDLSRRVMIVAEIGNNHEGSLGRAEEMIGRAAEAGADAVKFQAIVPERLVSAGETDRIAQLGHLCLGLEQFEHLAACARRAGVMFLSTPFDLASVAVLDPLVPAFKIASGDNDFFPLIDAVAATGKPILLSTGMLDLDGVARAKTRIEHAWAGCNSGAGDSGKGGGLVLLHCVVAYPTPPEQAGLSALGDLARLGCPVGYSDHTLGIDAAVLSVALGARVIEKHFTLDKRLSSFRDHQLSADPTDLAELVNRVRLAETLIGEGGKRMMPVEEPNSIAARRAVAAARDLPAGTILDAADLTWVRPRRGLPPGQEVVLLGRRLDAPVASGAPVLPEHLVSERSGET